jgi:hypothetical protein
MTDEFTPAKLSNLFEHWIEHNTSHVESFNTWAGKIKQAGYTEAAENIVFAAEKMNESIEHLKKAQQEIAVKE